MSPHDPHVRLYATTQRRDARPMAVSVSCSSCSRLGRAALISLATSLATAACSAGRTGESAPPAATSVAAQTPPAATPEPTTAGAHAPPPPPPPEMMAGTHDARQPPPAPSGAPVAGDAKGMVVIGTPTSNVGSVPNAERTLAGMRFGLRYCYDRGLVADPQAHGHLKITMKIAPTGEVKEVTLTPANVLSPPVRACIAARVQAGRFDPPKGGATTLSVPVGFGEER